MNAKSLGVAALGVVAWMGTLWADPIVWKGGADTSWNTAANWEPATVPNASGAEVDLSAASGTINIASAVTVGNLAFSPVSARSLTITGAKLTFAATGGVPTVTVGAGGKLLPTCIVGGTQGLKKYGAGEFNPKAYNAASGMLAGTHEVVEGVVAPVFNAADGYPGNPIQVDAGATLRQTHSDMYGSWQDVFVHGGTYDVGACCDYINEIVIRDGGRVTGTGFLVQDCMTTPRLLAQGDGFAGLFDVNLRINSCFLDARYHVDGVRTQQIEVANAGATLATTRNIYENRGSAVVNNDLWMHEWRSNAGKGWKYGSALEKTGAGDWLLFDSNVTVTGPTTVKGGRLVLSNKVSMAATKVVADTADKLVVKSGATVTVGGLEIASGDLDLGGNVVRIGGPNPAVDAFFGGRRVLRRSVRERHGRQVRHLPADACARTDQYVLRQRDFAKNFCLAKD